MVRRESLRLVGVVIVFAPGLVKLAYPAEKGSGMAKINNPKINTGPSQAEARWPPSRPKTCCSKELCL
jgi:hypothetical protein